MTTQQIPSASLVDVDTAVADRRQSPARRWRRPVGAMVAMVAILIAWASLPLWEWSFIDDGQLLAALDDNVARHGVIAGVGHAVLAAVRFDLDWGLFRPSYWGYVATFYLLPSGAAHAVRLAMAWVALAGPLVLLARRPPVVTRPVTLTLALATMLANVSLYLGLWYPSLQELSGLAFIGAGLWTRRYGARVVCWLLAAWFKAPFAWVLVALGVVRWWQGHRRSGAVAAALGGATLAVAAAFARVGTYTAAAHLGVDRVADNLLRSAAWIGPTLLVLLLGVLGLGLRVRPKVDPLALVLLLGGAGYFATLLPWRTDEHYAAPYVYLLGVGALLLLDGGERVVVPRAAPAVVVVVAAAAVAFAGAMVREGAQTVVTTARLRDCVRALPADSVIGYNRPEAWLRLEQIVKRRDPAWRGRLALVAPGRVVGWRGDQSLPLDYYIHDTSRGDSAAVLTAAPVVCRAPLATVHKVSR